MLPPLTGCCKLVTATIFVALLFFALAQRYPIEREGGRFSCSSMAVHLKLKYFSVAESPSRLSTIACVRTELTDEMRLEHKKALLEEDCQYWLLVQHPGSLHLKSGT